MNKSRADNREEELLTIGKEIQDRMDRIAMNEAQREIRKQNQREEKSVNGIFQPTNIEHRQHDIINTSTVRCQITQHLCLF